MKNDGKNLPSVPSHLKPFNPCPAELIKMPHPFLTVSQSDYLIQIVDVNSHTEEQIVQIQISWLLKKPTDLDLHLFVMAGYVWVQHDKG